jgi:hypothetical protein
MATLRSYDELFNYYGYSPYWAPGYIYPAYPNYGLAPPYPR